MKRPTQQFFAFILTVALLTGSASEGLAAVAASASAAAGRAGMPVGAVGANLGSAGLGALSLSGAAPSLALPSVSNLALPNNVSLTGGLNSAAAVETGAVYGAAPSVSLQPSAQGRTISVAPAARGQGERNPAMREQADLKSAAPSAKPAAKAVAAASERAAAVQKAAGDLSAGRIGLGAAVSAGRAMFDRGSLSASDDAAVPQDASFGDALDLGKPLSAIFTPVTREQAEAILAGLSGNERFAGLNAGDALQRSWLAPVVAEIAKTGASAADAAFNASDEAVYKMYALQNAAEAARTRGDLARVVAEMEALELPLGLYTSVETHEAFRAQASAARQRLSEFAAQTPRRSGLAAASSDARLAARDAVFTEMGREAVPAAAAPSAVDAEPKAAERSAATTVKAALAWSLADFGFAFLALLVAGWTRHEFTPNYGEGGDLLSLVGPIELLFAGAVVAPIAEEVIFRGFMQGGLSKVLSKVRDSALMRFWIPAVAVSGLFVVIHETGDAFLMAVRFVGAMILSAAFYRHGFWTSALLHGIHNGLAMTAGVLFMIGLPEAALVVGLIWFSAAVYSAVSLARAKIRRQDKRGAALTSTGAFIAAGISLAGAILTPLSPVTVAVAYTGAGMLALYGLMKLLQARPRGPRRPKVPGYQLAGRAPEVIRAQIQRLTPRHGPMSREDFDRIGELFAELRSVENAPAPAEGSREWKLSIFKALASELKGDGQTSLMLAAFLDAGDYARVQQFYRARSLPRIVADQNIFIRQLYKFPGVRDSSWFRENTRLGRVLDALDASRRRDSEQVSGVNATLNSVNFTERKEAAVRTYFSLINRLLSAGDFSPYYARLMKGYAYPAASEAGLIDWAQAEVLKHPLEVPEDFSAELAVRSGKAASKSGYTPLFGFAGLGFLGAALSPQDSAHLFLMGFAAVMAGLFTWFAGKMKSNALERELRHERRAYDQLRDAAFIELALKRYEGVEGIAGISVRPEDPRRGGGRVLVLDVTFRDPVSMRKAADAGRLPSSFTLNLSRRPDEAQAILAVYGTQLSPRAYLGGLAALAVLPAAAAPTWPLALLFGGFLLFVAVALVQQIRSSESDTETMLYDALRDAFRNEELEKAARAELLKIPGVASVSFERMTVPGTEQREYVGRAVANFRNAETLAAAKNAGLLPEALTVAVPVTGETRTMALEASAPAQSGAALAGLAFLPLLAFAPAFPVATAAGVLALAAIAGGVWWIVLRNAENADGASREYAKEPHIALLRAIFYNEARKAFASVDGVQDIRFGPRGYSGFSSEMTIIFNDAESLRAAVESGAIPENFEAVIRLGLNYSLPLRVFVDMAASARQPAPGTKTVPMLGLAALPLVFLSGPAVWTAVYLAAAFAGAAAAIAWAMKYSLARKKARMKFAENENLKYANLLQEAYESEARKAFSGIPGIANISFDRPNALLTVSFKDPESLRDAVASGLISKNISVNLPYYSAELKTYAVELELGWNARQPGKYAKPEMKNAE